MSSSALLKKNRKIQNFENSKNFIFLKDPITLLISLLHQQKIMIALNGFSKKLQKLELMKLLPLFVKTVNVKPLNLKDLLKS